MRVVYAAPRHGALYAVADHQAGDLPPRVQGPQAEHLGGRATAHEEAQAAGHGTVSSEQSQV